MFSPVPRRSLLFVPGSKARALEKAANLPVDAVILDLEDAVLPEAKETARAAVVQAVASGRYGPREVIVRCNGLDSPWGAADVEAAARSGAHAVLLPKVESPETLRHAAARLEAAGAPSSQRLMAMIETPRGVWEARSIAAATERMEALIVGPNDLEASTGIRQMADRAPMVPILIQLVLAARAEGRSVIDGVHSRLDDDEGFLDACRQGVSLGFDGKTLIHPKQIEPANAVFGPSREAVAEARQVLDAWTVAQAEGKGVTTLEGRMIEALHAETARRTVALSEAIEARLDAPFRRR